MLKLYSIDDVCDATSFSRGNIYKQVKAGLFTAPMHWGKSSRWPASEIEAIFEARLAGKSDDEIRAIIKELYEARRARNGGAE